MNNNVRRRRINVHAFAEKLLCHEATIKRRIKNPPPGFPMPDFLFGKYFWWEDQVDAYVELLGAESRAQRESA
jgi:hypothetical protein